MVNTRTIQHQDIFNGIFIFELVYWVLKDFPRWSSSKYNFDIPQGIIADCPSTQSTDFEFKQASLNRPLE